MTSAYDGTVRSAALQRVLDDLEAERYRPVPPPPAPTSDELAARARIIGVLLGQTEEAP